MRKRGQRECFEIASRSGVWCPELRFPAIRKTKGLKFSNGLQSRSGHQTPEARHIEKYIIKSLRMMILGDFCYVFFRQM
jgi:hypothetical protein